MLRKTFSTLQQSKTIMKFIGMCWYMQQYYLSCFINKLFQFSDIGANLTDGMFRGNYNGSQKHPEDLDIVLERSWSTGLEKIIITVGTFTDIEDAIKIAHKDGIRLKFNKLIKLFEFIFFC